MAAMPRPNKRMEKLLESIIGLPQNKINVRKKRDAYYDKVILKDQIQREK